MTIMHSPTVRSSRSFTKPSVTRYFFPEYVRTWLHLTLGRAFSTGDALNSLRLIFSRSPRFTYPSNHAFMYQMPETFLSIKGSCPLISALSRFSY